MNDKYSVILKLVWYNENGHPHFYNYTCKHIIGGLKELVFNLEFDKEYFSYAYRHSETTLQFIKDDMIEILNCSTGNSVVDSGGNRIQDHSYIASGKINIKIVDNHTNIVFLESFLDLNRQKITPLYLEIPLIENVDVKEKIENEISYSLEEIKNSVIEIDTTNYAGNDVIEEATLYGTALLDDSWRLDPNKPDSVLIYQGGGRVAGYPEQWLRVTGNSDDKIYARGEYWGELGGDEKVWVSRYEGDEYGFIVFRGAQAYSTGGFTILAKYPKRVKISLKINLYLKRERKLTWKGAQFGYSPDNLQLKMKINYWNFFDQRIEHIATIQRQQDGIYDFYELKDYPYSFEINWLPGVDYSYYGQFFIKFGEKFYTDYGGGDTSQYSLHLLTNAELARGYSFKCEATIDAVANSSIHAQHKLSGVRLLDYLNFIAQKVGVLVEYQNLINYGLNNILYSSENFIDFKKRQLNEEGFLEKIENCSLKNILDWLNTQFCLSIYIDENNKLTLTTRDYFVNLALGGRQEMIDVNRVIEIMPQKFIKKIYAGSVRNELQFTSKNESTNTECTWELETELDGTELNILCPICTDPQFIDWMLMAKTITGGKKCLIETITIGTTVSLNVVKPTKITPNRTGETISNPFPNFTNFTTRNFTNVFLSPLAQFERWRRYITTPPNNIQYKMIKCDTNFINVIPNLQRLLFPYMKIYNYSGSNVYFNNSNTIVGGFPNSTTNVKVGVRDYTLNGHLLPLKFKVETPIYSQFLQARRKAIATFTYNGKKIIGYPNVVKTFFGEQVQEIEIEAIETSTITNINDLIE